jgi:hypothetical protein
MTRQNIRKILSLFLFGALLFGAFGLIVGCGGGSSSTTPPQTITGTGSNVQPISVNLGVTNSYPDGAFTSVTVCAPGSTTNCQVIGNILVDTGSSGLRILGSALGSVTLTQATVNDNPLAECLQYLDGSFNWGPVQTADVQIGGETAHSLPVQVLDDAFSVIPSATCTGTPVDTQADLQANGILGVGSVQYDCGSNCTSNIPAFDQYYQCSTTAPVTCSVSSAALNLQVQNPISLFATDNNGVIIELPAVTTPQTSITGSMVFGIGTESNNGLGTATVLPIDPGTLEFTTTFENTAMAQSFIDSGSNGLFFDSNSLTECSDVSYYCPTTTANLSAVNTGTTGTASVHFDVQNADMLINAFNTSGDAVLPGLGAPSNTAGAEFDWGLPFFFGRNVYTSIAGTTAPGGTTPYWAYPPN